jgi:glutamate synthase (NADPH/NADH) large chain
VLGCCRSSSRAVPAPAAAPACEEARLDALRKPPAAIDEGYELIILSDRGVGRSTRPSPSLLATLGVHHHLIREGTRTKWAWSSRPASPRGAPLRAALVGYGAGAVNPYLALRDDRDMVARRGAGRPTTPEKAVHNYIKALGKGVLKVMSKMGISTLQSYKGAQIFEAVGLNQESSTSTSPAPPPPHRGIGLDDIAEECAAPHTRAYPPRPTSVRAPRTSRAAASTSGAATASATCSTRHGVHRACSTRRAATKRYEIFKEYTRRWSTTRASSCTLRGLFEVQARPSRPVPLEEVEPGRRSSSASRPARCRYGSISPEAHETLAIAMNRIGGKSNTGEGGEDPSASSRDANGDSRRSAIKQVASAASA